MRELLVRFAEIVMAKLTRLVTEYTLVRRDDADETLTESSASRALAWALAKVAHWLEVLPWLISEPKRDHVHEEFDRLVAYLRAPTHMNMNGAQPA